MRKALTIVALAIGSTCFVAGVIVYQDPSLLGSPRSGTSRSEVCARCAARRSVEVREWGGMTGWEEVEKISSTELSELLDHFGAPTCDHEWFTTSHSAWFEGGGHAHGTGDADATTVGVLVDTAAGSRALLSFAEATGRRPHSVWKTLADWCRTRIERDPFFDDLPHDEPANRGRIIEWLRQNYAAVERTAKERSTRRPGKGGGSKGGGPTWLKRLD